MPEENKSRSFSDKKRWGVISRLDNKVEAANGGLRANILLNDPAKKIDGFYLEVST